MKFRLLSALFAPALVMGLAACDVDQTREGDLPDIEVAIDRERLHFFDPASGLAIRA